MAIARTTLAALIAAFGLTLTANNADAAPGAHIDRLALQLQGQARGLMTELRLHFRHTSQYGHMISDSAQIYGKAAHIHRVAHISGGPMHVRRDLAELDRLFHHLEGLVGNVQAHASHGHGGHLHGRLGHVNRLMAEMENTLHHMRRDMAFVSPGPHPGHGPVLVPAPVPAPFPGHGGFRPAPGNGHSGISFGNGQFGFRIGF
jgi:hypothetical protein